MLLHMLAFKKLTNLSHRKSLTSSLEENRDSLIFILKLPRINIHFVGCVYPASAFLLDQIISPIFLAYFQCSMTQNLCHLLIRLFLDHMISPLALQTIFSYQIFIKQLQIAYVEVG